VSKLQLSDRVDILLVEDNPYDEKLTLRVLRKHHLASLVHVVRDGAEALDFMFAAGEYAGRNVEVGPKVILLDIKLPKIDGLEVLRRIREDPRTRSQPIVLLTSSAEQRDVDAAYEHHANSYIVKPVDFEQFTEAVRELGLYWLLLNRPPFPSDRDSFVRGGGP
jgi:two-component system response regulator